MLPQSGGCHQQVSRPLRRPYRQGREHPAPIRRLLRWLRRGDGRRERRGEAGARERLYRISRRAERVSTARRDAAHRCGQEAIHQALRRHPEDKKPEDWDDAPAEIPDPSAEKPEDWDDEDDGEWEAPMIPNPEYKGEWSPRMIPNPAYEADDKIYNVCKDCEYVGFELWQVKSGSIFDDIIVTDSIEEAEAFAKETYLKKAAAEKKMYETIKEDEKKAQEEELAAAGAAEDEDYDEDEEL